jgi:hypothetical protein
MRPRLRLTPEAYKRLCRLVLDRDHCDARNVVPGSCFRCTTSRSEVDPVTTQKKAQSRSAILVMSRFIAAEKHEADSERAPSV